MNFYVQAALGAVFMLNSGCAPDLLLLTMLAEPKQDKNVTWVEPAAPVEPTQTLSRCDEEKQQMINGKTPLLNGEEQEIEIVRINQRIIRYSCDKKIVSDELETLKRPLAQFTLNAPTPYRKFVRVKVLNGASCDSKESGTMPIKDLPLFGQLNVITGDGEKEIQIKGDMADAWLTFHMGENLNNIFVRYYFENGEYATVEYRVHVKYKEITKPGVGRAFPDDCPTKK